MALSLIWQSTQRFFHHVGQTAFLVAGGGASLVGFAHIKIVIVPGHLFQQTFTDLFVNRRGVNR